jgi:hypothetical protein
MLVEWGFGYTGFDLSTQAIKMATEKGLDGARFEVADATKTDLYRTSQYDAVLATEVLEHIHDDTRILDSIVPGKYCLCTVPSFPYVSHVRHFESADAVESRYSRFFDEFDLVSFRRPGRQDHRYYLFEGLKRRA